MFRKIVTWIVIALCPEPAFTEPANSPGVNALRAGCALTRSAVTISTARPSATSAPTDRRSPPTVRLSMAAIALSGASIGAERRARTIERLMAATPTMAAV